MFFQKVPKSLLLTFTMGLLWSVYLKQTYSDHEEQKYSLFKPTKVTILDYMAPAA